MTIDQHLRFLTLVGKEFTLVIRRGRSPIISPKDSPPQIDLNNAFAAINPSRQSDSDDEQSSAKPLTIPYHPTMTAITAFQS